MLARKRREPTRRYPAELEHLAAAAELVAAEADGKLHALEKQRLQYGALLRGKVGEAVGVNMRFFGEGRVGDLLRERAEAVVGVCAAVCDDRVISLQNEAQVVQLIAQSSLAALRRLGKLLRAYARGLEL